MATHANKKILLILVDGVGDVGITQQEGKTPLQYVKTPYIDLLSKSGVNGLMDSVEAGYACGSDTSHMNIFGYSPFKYYKGRGAFETMGSGLPMVDGDIAFKCNFSNIDPESKIVKLRRVDRDFPDWGLPQISKVDSIKIPGYENYKVSALHATEHRIGLKVHGPNLSNDITGTDPLKDNLKLIDCKATETGNADAEMTADLVNKLSQAMVKVLSQEPINLAREKQGLPTANIVILRGCGVKIKLDPFFKRHGLNGFAICPTCILNGLSQSIGLKTFAVPGATGDYHTNLFVKADKSMDLFLNGSIDETTGERQDYQFGFLHIKAIDETGHDKNMEQRLVWLEKIDKMLEHLVNKWGKIFRDQGMDMSIAITGDHSTPVLYGDHTAHPVPFAISSVGLMVNEQAGTNNFGIKDGVELYDEVSCGQGSLGRFSGCEAIEFMKNFTGFVNSKI